MKKLWLLAALGASALLAACGSSNECTKKTCSGLSASCGSPSDGCGGTLSCGTCASGLACGDGNNNSVAYVCGFAQPAGTVPVDFKVDDSVNKLYKDAELDWKGSFGKPDGGARVVTFDSSWQGGGTAAVYPKLYDDGPWNKGGHEPIGATAGDHILGVTIFVAPPATGKLDFGYGLQDAVYNQTWTTIAGAGETPDGWMWPGGTANGAFSVLSTSPTTTPVNAGNFTVRAGGDRDIKFVIDSNALATGTWDKSKIQLKSNAWYWGTVTLVDDGTKYGDDTASDGKYTFVLSTVVPTPFVHNSLLHQNDKIEFIFQFKGVEYKDSGGSANTAGVTVYTRTGTSGTFAPTTVTVNSSKNTEVTIP
jgi:hypothetical protein